MQIVPVAPDQRLRSASGGDGCGTGVALVCDRAARRTFRKGQSSTGLLPCSGALCSGVQARDDHCEGPIGQVGGVRCAVAVAPALEDRVEGGQRHSGSHPRIKIAVRVEVVPAGYLRGQVSVPLHLAFQEARAEGGCTQDQLDYSERPVGVIAAGGDGDPDSVPPGDGWGLGDGACGQFSVDSRTHLGQELDDHVLLRLEIAKKVRLETPAAVVISSTVTASKPLLTSSCSADSVSSPATSRRLRSAMVIPAGSVTRQA